MQMRNSVFIQWAKSENDSLELVIHLRVLRPPLVSSVNKHQGYLLRVSASMFKHLRLEPASLVSLETNVYQRPTSLWAFCCFVFFLFQPLEEGLVFKWKISVLLENEREGTGGGGKEVLTSMRHDMCWKQESFGSNQVTSIMLKGSRDVLKEHCERVQDRYASVFHVQQYIQWTNNTTPSAPRLLKCALLTDVP